jgi:hypothetical protein
MFMRSHSGVLGTAVVNASNLRARAANMVWAANPRLRRPQERAMSDGPIQEGATEATREEKIRGILAQVRQDMEQGYADDREQLLRQRLDEAGISATDDELRG